MHWSYCSVKYAAISNTQDCLILTRKDSLNNEIHTFFIFCILVAVSLACLCLSSLADLSLHCEDGLDWPLFSEWTLVGVTGLLHEVLHRDLSTGSSFNPNVDFLPPCPPTESIGGIFCSWFKLLFSDLFLWLLFREELFESCFLSALAESFADLWGWLGVGGLDSGTGDKA